MKNKFIIETKYNVCFNILSGYIKRKFDISKTKDRLKIPTGCEFLIYNEDSGIVVAKNNKKDYGYSVSDIGKETIISEDLGIIYEPKSLKTLNNVKIETKMILIPNIISDLINGRFEISKLCSVFKTRLKLLNKYYLYVYSESGIIVSGHLKEDSEFHTYNNDKISDLGLSNY